jgi:hypothetical protein
MPLDLLVALLEALFVAGDCALQVFQFIFVSGLVALQVGQTSLQILQSHRVPVAQLADYSHHSPGLADQPLLLVGIMFSFDLADDVLDSRKLVHSINFGCTGNDFFSIFIIYAAHYSYSLSQHHQLGTHSTVRPPVHVVVLIGNRIINMGRMKISGLFMRAIFQITRRSAKGSRYFDEAFHVFSSVRFFLFI